MKNFVVGMLTIIGVLACAVGGSVWLADSVRDHNPVTFLAGAGAFALAIAMTYVIGEALEQTGP